ncbi:hypothetical protein SAMN05216344_11669 [Polaromonas sp. OV174]|uniref:hypothetical protein n=1 Tax=Polaromonas sp. OV174 TaxID=1855300 RepID=UPI0008ED83D1|nr:hypothetical protein [Polaromonas sp. OV174]SFC40618.1 hypothetical protein SAMN05216344_11669 [Polaromonas sp. OV174]
MKILAITFYLVMLASFASAQTTSAEDASARIATERARIGADRSRLEAGFLAEDVACYKKFLVNRCLGEVNARRRAAMADLRRQEIALNDEERALKGADQLQKIEEKSSPEKQQEAAERRTKAMQDHQSRLDREKNKQQQGATAQSNAKANSEASANKLKSNQDKADGRAAKQAETAAAAQKFNDRQKEALQRRAQHESDRLKRVDPPAKSLPLPE